MIGAEQLPPAWAQALAAEFDQPYMSQLDRYLERERAAGHTIYPPAADIFRAFELTPFDEVRVVIVGQDPYHGPGQAHGLAFSVQPGIALPPSLRNIFQELAGECDVPMPARHRANGNLEHWARQGVLLMNTSLTVGEGDAGSHARRGWERFTDRAIAELSLQRDGLVFLLWGRHAQARGASIDRERHHVLTAAHPSPLSARKGFFGCGHFARTNELLGAAGGSPIDWALPPNPENLA